MINHPPLPHDHGHTPQDLSCPPAQQLQKAADCFRLLGDASRLRLFCLLCQCEECVINLSALMGMSSPALSHHLRQLKSCGLVVSRREGKEVYYRAADTPQARLLHQTALQLAYAEDGT